MIVWLSDRLINIIILIIILYRSLKDRWSDNFCAYILFRWRTSFITRWKTQSLCLTARTRCDIGVQFSAALSQLTVQCLVSAVYRFFGLICLLLVLMMLRSMIAAAQILGLYSCTPWSRRAGRRCSAAVILMYGLYQDLTVSKPDHCHLWCVRYCDPRRVGRQHLVGLCCCVDLKIGIVRPSTFLARDGRTWSAF